MEKYLIGFNFQEKEKRTYSLSRVDGVHTCVYILVGCYLSLTFTRIYTFLMKRLHIDRIHKVQVLQSIHIYNSAISRRPME